MSAAVEDRSRWSRGGALRALLIACVTWGVGAALGYAITHQPAHDDAHANTTQAATETASAAELALVAPLTPGAELEGWTIAAIEPVRAGTLRLHLTRDEAQLDLDVALTTPSSPPAPATAGPYGVYYATHDTGPASDGASLAAALAHVMQSNTSVPVPPGMAGFEGRDQDP